MAVGDTVFEFLATQVVYALWKAYFLSITIMSSRLSFCAEVKLQSALSVNWLSWKRKHLVLVEHVEHRRREKVVALEFLPSGANKASTSRLPQGLFAPLDVSLAEDQALVIGTPCVAKRTRPAQGTDCTAHQGGFS